MSQRPHNFLDSLANFSSLDGGDPFDSTPGVFDSTGVNEYLNGTGQLGGPLVTAPDVTDRSDLRLFSSDNNATIASMSEESSFQATCNGVFEKMINTVPATVTLTDVITPMTWKGVDLALDISSAGDITVGGLIRNLWTTTAPGDTVSYSITTGGVNSTEQSSASSGTGSSLYGNTTYFPFNSSITSDTTDLTIESTISYPIKTDIFVLPEQSTIDSTTFAYTLRAAALTTIANSNDTLTGTLYVPVAYSNVFLKKITNTTLELTATGTAGDYTLFEGSVTSTTSTNVVIKVNAGDSISATVKSDILQSL